MTRLEAIDALLVKVKAGDFDPSDTIRPRWKFNKFCDAFEAAFGVGNRHLERTWNAYKGSTDAAIALCEAVLPEWEYGLNFDAHGEKYAFVGDGGVFETEEVYNANHARALLIAILEAMKAKEEASA